MVDLLLHLALPFHEPGHLVVRQGLAEPGGDSIILVHEVYDLLYALLDDLAPGPGVVELRLLLQKPDRIAGRKNCLARELPVLACHDPEKRALARAVQTDHADLRAVIVS